MQEFKFNFEKLAVWQRARSWVKELYAQTNAFPPEERYRLADQIRRAGISVASNIAEGSTRKSFKDQERFFEVAYGSLMEICCQLQLAADVGLISEEIFSQNREKIREISLMLAALKTGLSNRQ